MEEAAGSNPAGSTKIMSEFKKPLIAIVTCHRFKNRADGQRATWIPEVKGMDYKFFLGSGGDRPPGADEVFLDVNDDYPSLPWKVRAVMKWADEHGYDCVLKCDDDTFICPEKLELPLTPYEGRVNHSHVRLIPNGWCSGFAYWLAGIGLKAVAYAEEPTTGAEDLWTGIVLNKTGFRPRDLKSFIALSVISTRMWSDYRNRVAAACEFKDGLMFQIHGVIRKLPPYDQEPVERSPMNPRLGIRTARFGEVLRRRR